MAKHKVSILHTEFITPNVKRFTLERPAGYAFEPGQAADVAINKPGWEEQRRPFTFTSLPGAKRLELIIKIYEKHDGVTKQLGLLHTGDELLLHDVFGAIQYKGPGFFIAGGAGVTPFIAILRHLHEKKQLRGNTLLVSNRTADDVILDDEFTKLLGKRFLKVFTRQHVIGFHERRIDRDTLITLVQNFDQHFYVCGPDDFVRDINAMLLTLGAKSESLVFEQ
ncbi:MAG: flavodoxin reductase [Flavobacteriales bacterium]|nr:flavodoxin reductase [Flavobacteriales bacterium]